MERLKATKIYHENTRQFDRVYYEVFNQIFGYLRLAGRVSCAMTCKAWPKRSSEWHGMWSTVDLTPRPGHFEKYGIIVPSLVGKRVRNILDRWPVDATVDPLKIIYDHNFEGLQSLSKSLNKIFLQRLFAECFFRNKEYLFRIIDLNRNTLTIIAILSIQASVHLEAPETVLSTYTNLTYLGIRFMLDAQPPKRYKPTRSTYAQSIILCNVVGNGSKNIPANAVNDNIKEPKLKSAGHKHWCKTCKNSILHRQQAPQTFGRISS